MPSKVYGKLKLLTEVPVDIKKGQMVSFDIEMFQQSKEKLHRPHGTFACISVAVEGREELYQLYDTADLKKLFLSAKSALWVGHNMLYDLKQLIRFVEIKPRYIHDTMLLEQAMYGGYYQNFSLKDLVRRYLGIVMEKTVRDEFEEATVMTQKMKEYAALDAKYTLQIAMMQREQHENAPGYSAYRDIDEKMIWPVLDIKGIPVDVEAWTNATNDFQATADKLQGDLGFNVNSQPQVLAACKKAGIHLQNTQAATLEAYKDVDLIANILKTRMYRKATSTYGLKWLEKYVEADGKVYSSWHITGAETGRMSCVSGSTLLHTSRGTIRIEEYIPKQGDKIYTHTGEAKDIIRKIYKGVDKLVQVECSNGSVVQCTLNHKLHTPQGWVRVGDLHLTSEVTTNVHLETIYQQQREYNENPADVFRGRPQVWLSADSGQLRNEVCQCSVHSEQVRGRGTEERRKEHTHVSVETGRIESGTPKETSKLHWYDRGWKWIPSKEGERKVCSGTSKCSCKSSRDKESALLSGCSPHRWEQAEQRARQSCTGHSVRTSETTYQTTTISKITPLGTMDVWDIEVADDHSYCAGGLIHHNSSDPNGQNIPARKLPIFRTFFTASDGHRFIVDDVSQQEPCILAYESQDAVLTRAIMQGEDLHLAVAREIFNDPSMKKEDDRRAVGKTINLGTAYGLSAPGCARKLNIELEQAEKFLQQYFARFTGVFTWIAGTRANAYQTGYVKTASGRRIFLNTYNNQWQNNAINAPIQGGAADFTKMWVRKYWEKCNENSLPYSLCLIVHDELGLDVPKEAVKETNRIRKEAFDETAETLFKGIPFKSESVMGKNWGVKQTHEEDDDEEDGAWSKA